MSRHQKRTPPAQNAQARPHARGGMCEGRTIGGSSLRVQSGHRPRFCRGYALPSAPKKNAPRPNAPTRPTGGKDSVKENRQGCLSCFIRAGAFKSVQGMRSPRHQQKRRLSASFLLVPLTGIEPVRCFHRGILSPLRLPVPPQRRRAGINLTHLTIALRKSQAQGLTNPHRALYNTLVNSKKGIDRVSAAPPPPERKPPG